MMGFVILAVLLLSAVAGIMGWVVDSRDPTYSLWPLKGSEAAKASRSHVSSLAAGSAPPGPTDRRVSCGPRAARSAGRYPGHLGRCDGRSQRRHGTSADRRAMACRPARQMPYSR